MKILKKVVVGVLIIIIAMSVINYNNVFAVASKAESFIKSFVASAPMKSDGPKSKQINIEKIEKDKNGNNQKVVKNTVTARTSGNYYIYISEENTLSGLSGDLYTNIIQKGVDPEVMKEEITCDVLVEKDGKKVKEKQTKTTADWLILVMESMEYSIAMNQTAHENPDQYYFNQIYQYGETLKKTNQLTEEQKKKVEDVQQDSKDAQEAVQEFNEYDEVEDDDSDLGGQLLTPIVDFVNIIADSLQAITTKFMRSDLGWREILVGKSLSVKFKNAEDDGIKYIEPGNNEKGQKYRHVIWYVDSDKSGGYSEGDQILTEVEASDSPEKVSGVSFPKWTTSGEDYYNDALLKTKELVSGSDVENYDGNDDGTYFIDATGYNNRYSYVQMAYSPEEIFSGKVGILNANFFNKKDFKPGTPFMILRNVIIYWFRALRYIGLAALLSILIYTGIKIMTSSVAQDKAKYKERVLNWVIAIVIMFMLPYIMSFIYDITEKIVKIFPENEEGNSITVKIFDGAAKNGDWTGFIANMPVVGWITNLASDILGNEWHGEKYTYTKFTTNLMGFVRFQSQSRVATKKIGYEIMYIMLIVYTIRYTVIYLKRMIYVAFLTMISPIVAMMYPIDKMSDGQSQSFSMWLREYIFNALLQPLHMLLYYVFVTSAMSFAAENIIYVIVVLGFMTHAEEILKQIFGFGKAPMGTVGGLSGGAATALALSNITNTASNVMRMATSNNSKKKVKTANQNLHQGGSNDSENSFDYTDFQTSGLDRLQELTDAKEQSHGRNRSTIGELERRYLDIEKQHFGSKENERFNQLTSGANGLDKYDAIRQILAEREMNNAQGQPEENNQGKTTDIDQANPIPIERYAINRKYAAPKGTAGQALGRMLTRRAQAAKYAMGFKAGDGALRNAGHILGTGTVRTIKGVAGLTAKVAPVIAGMAVGAGAVITQAAISLAMDGKYNPLEGATTFAAATVGTSKLLNKAGDAIFGLGTEYNQTKYGKDYDRDKRTREFLQNKENFVAYQKKYGEFGYGKLVSEVARGGRLAGKGVTDLNEQMQVAAYTDSMVDEEFNQKYGNMTDRQLHKIAESIRNDARKHGDNRDPNILKLSDKDTIRTYLRTDESKGMSYEDIAVKTMEAQKQIGNGVINGGKKKQEEYIEKNTDNEQSAEAMRRTIDSSKKMKEAQKLEKERLEKLKEEYKENKTGEEEQVSETKTRNLNAKAEVTSNKTITEKVNSKNITTDFNDDKEDIDLQIGLMAIDLASKSENKILNKEELQDRVTQKFGAILGDSVEETTNKAMKKLKASGAIKKHGEKDIKLDMGATDAQERFNSFMSIMKGRKRDKSNK